MTKLKANSVMPIDGKSHLRSDLELKKMYAHTHIPPEKKPYFTHLGESSGAWLAVNKNKVILDASSQIASLGGGFNALAGFGTLHHQEAWLLNHKSEHFKSIRQAFENLLLEKAGQPHGHVFLCNSGAEANEIALGQCYQKRRYPTQKKVLAFKGSFHGRMMVSLSATWNPAKRAPFEWPGYECDFLDYPTLKSDNITAPKEPKGWLPLWESPMNKSYPAEFKKFNQIKDELLKTELNLLDNIKTKLAEKSIFAVILEPMQCEGGDKFSSARFHRALISLCGAYNVPLVYDEVQTGFGLGGSFFWHSQFNLENSNGMALYPDFIVCAKKAQTGLVISQGKIAYQESFSPASVFRGYYQAMNMEQSLNKILSMENKVRPLVKNLCDKFPNQIHMPRAKGLLFAFDFKDEKDLPKFVGARFDFGLLFYPAGSATARFRLNLGFADKEIKFLFNSLEGLLEQLTSGKPASKPKPPEVILPLGLKEQWNIHFDFLAHRTGNKKSSLSASQELKNFFEPLKTRLPATLTKGLKLEIITPRNFPKIKASLQKLQKRVYEPARQTAIENFYNVVHASHNISLGLFQGKNLIGVAFAGPLSLFPGERGTLRDPYLNDPQTLYMQDVTVHPDYQGYGLGKLLKYAVTKLGFIKGVNRIHGRNRDVLAAPMLAINYSLGAFTSEKIKGDYPDDLPHNDCIYYQAPMKWLAPNIDLAGGIECHLGGTLPSASFRKQYAPSLVNKICLSNFVSRDFMGNVASFLNKLPQSLRYGYTASGQSEAVDKITKVLWQKTRPAHKMITFRGCHFGEGGFMSRSLSGTGDGYFPVKRLDFPTKENENTILTEVKQLLKMGEYLGVWAEPLTQLTMQRMPLSFLRNLKQICTEFKVPLIYNDTASLFHRYARGSFTASGQAGAKPHAAFAWLGGQMAFAYVDKSYFIDTPLMLISTWDGDEYSLAAFLEADKRVENHQQVIDNFQKNLKALISTYPTREIDIQQGVGWIDADLPLKIQKMFKPIQGGSRHMIVPSLSEMKRFNNDYTKNKL